MADSIENGTWTSETEPPLPRIVSTPPCLPSARVSAIVPSRWWRTNRIWRFPSPPKKRFATSSTERTSISSSDPKLGGGLA